MRWISGSPTRNRRAAPTATAIFSSTATREPPGVTSCPTLAIASCIASAHAVARDPSSPSIQHVTASPLK